MKRIFASTRMIALFAALLILPPAPDAFGLSDAYKGNVFETGRLKPTDSGLKVKVGQKAPGFTLPAATWIDRVPAEEFFRVIGGNGDALDG